MVPPEKDESAAPPPEAELPSEPVIPYQVEASSEVAVPSEEVAIPSEAEARSNPPPPASEVAAPPPPPRSPPKLSLGERIDRLPGQILARARAYFAQDPTFWIAAAPLLLLSALLFTRLPTTNYIFDEQEALLANPYVNRTQGLTFIDAIHRDFWGLPPDRSVGSYRPIPNFLWRLLWHVTKQPFVHHFYNVLFHAVVGALLTLFAFRVTRRRDVAYLSGFIFVACAVLTEAVSGIVGIADVFGGMGALLALLALGLPGWAMPFAVFASILFALFSKESGLVCVPLVPFAALLVAPLTHPQRPARVARALAAFVAATAAFVLYVELRKRWFPSPLPAELQEALPENASRAKQLVRDFLVWFHQAPLPKDPLNNPLAEADPKFRIAGALRVYARGVGQVLFPKTLSGDYSFPQEPVPPRLVFPESVLGGLLLVVPPLAAVVFWILAMVRERRARIVAALPSVALAAGPGPGLALAAEHELAAPAITLGAPDAVPAPDAASAPDTARAPDTAPAPDDRRWMRFVGLALIAISVGAFALDAFVLKQQTAGLSWNFPIPFWLSRSGNGRFWHAVPWPFAFLPFGLLGLGLLADGRRKLVAPDAPGAPIPLGRSGILVAAIGLVWMVVSYFPHSNIPIVLPTVRAERFWYFPAIGTAFAIAVAFAWAHEVFKKRGLSWVIPAVFGLFFGFQCVQAYRHAMDYRNDLVFWEATRDAVPNSAKAHLNFSVMKGARGDLETRLVESKEAIRLAPEWPMAHIYTGDTLCRLHRAEEAWPHYKQGFAIGPNEQSLISLALQCLFDEKQLYAHDKELRELAEAHPGSWIAYLAVDTLDNSEKNNGVDPKYRPRGYNEGPKE